MTATPQTALLYAATACAFKAKAQQLTMRHCVELAMRALAVPDLKPDLAAALAAFFEGVVFGDKPAAGDALLNAIRAIMGPEPVEETARALADTLPRHALPHAWQNQTGAGFE